MAEKRGKHRALAGLHTECLGGRNGSASERHVRRRLDTAQIFILWNIFCSSKPLPSILLKHNCKLHSYL